MLSQQPIFMNTFVGRRIIGFKSHGWGQRQVTIIVEGRGPSGGGGGCVSGRVVGIKRDGRKKLALPTTSTLQLPVVRRIVTPCSSILHSQDQGKEKKEEATAAEIDAFRRQRDHHRHHHHHCERRRRQQQHKKRFFSSATTATSRTTKTSVNSTNTEDELLLNLYDSSTNSNNDEGDDDDSVYESDYDDDYDDDEEDEDRRQEDEEEEDEEDNMPWKNLLGLSSRAGWRSSDAFLPSHVLKAQEHVLKRAVTGGITNKQIKQSLAAIVGQHKALSERRERERRRLINGTYYTKTAQRRDNAIQPVLYGRQETLAVLKSRLQPNYFITKRVLEETKSLLTGLNNSNSNNSSNNNNFDDGSGFRPKRIIDMGIGVGSASAAALEIFPNDIEWIHGIDPSRCMRECSKSFLEEIMEESVSTTTSNSNSNNSNNPEIEDGEEEEEGKGEQQQQQQQQQPQRRINPPRLTLGGSIATTADTSSTTTSGTFDLALMTYTATELPHVSSTLSSCAILWQKLANNGVLIIIEPGTPDGFNTIRAVRNMLLDCCPPSSSSSSSSSSSEAAAAAAADDDQKKDHGDECHIIAPCTHNGKCPMERYQRDFFKKTKHLKTQVDMENMVNNTATLNSDNVDEDDRNQWEDMKFESLDLSTDHNKKKRRQQQQQQQRTTDETQLLGGRYCSFVQTMSSGSGSHHFRRGEKFSYLVAQKRCPPQKQKEEEEDAGVGGEAKVVEHNIDDNNKVGGGSFHNDRLRDLLANVYKAKEEAVFDDDEDDNNRRRPPHEESSSSSLEAQRNGGRKKVQDLFEKAQALELKYLDSEEDELGLEFLQGDKNRSSFGRIVRAPLKRRGHVYIDYCAAPGRLIRSRVTKSLADSVAPGLYTAARKSRWGGLWPDCHNSLLLEEDNAHAPPAVAPADAAQGGGQR